MKKYMAKMTEEGKEFMYALYAEDLFEANEDANKIAVSRGWLCLDVAPYDLEVIQSYW